MGNQSHLINAYFCDAGRRDVLVEYVAGYPRYEPSFVNDIVFERSRGKAKSRFLYHRGHGEIEFTEVRCRLLARDCATQPGLADSSDPLWDRC